MAVCTFSERARKYSQILHQTRSESIKLVNKQHEHNVSILQDQRIKVKIQKKEKRSCNVLQKRN